ncbi:plasmid mobilization protein [Hominenteromicrobium sp.]|uniref:plasmid mobilization protein n=1 Tax=Hominenteromicrobium sp. TaxID=3073581 RepID=UPI003A8F140D
MPQKSQSQPKSADSLGAQPPNPPGGEMCMGKDVRIAVRVTAKEKERIQAKARKCGLSTTEYVKQRALGYKPRTVPPDALFACLEKLGELADKASSTELNKEIYTVLKQITAEFLLPGKG